MANLILFDVFEQRPDGVVRVLGALLSINEQVATSTARALFRERSIDSRMVYVRADLDADIPARLRKMSTESFANVIDGLLEFLPTSEPTYVILGEIRRRWPGFRRDNL